MTDNMSANLLTSLDADKVGSCWSQAFIYIANKWTETYLRLQIIKQKDFKLENVGAVSSCPWVQLQYIS